MRLAIRVRQAKRNALRPFIQLRDRWMSLANDRCRGEAPQPLKVAGGEVACHAVEEARDAVDLTTAA